MTEARLTPYNPSEDVEVVNQESIFTVVPELSSEKSVFTEQQTKRAGYATIMDNAEKRLTDIENSGAGFMNMFGPTGWYDNKIDQMFGQDPTDPAVFSRYLMSNKYKLYEAEARRWMMAKLRDESGAAIPETEILGGTKAYFPMIGAGEEEIAAKREARRQAAVVMREQAGGAYAQARKAIDDSTVVGTALTEVKERARTNKEFEQKAIQIGILNEGWRNE